MRILLLIVLSTSFLRAQKSIQDIKQKAIDYYQCEKFDSALIYFNKVIELNPFDSISYIDRALTKEMLNNYCGAVADYSRLARIDSNGVDAYFLRGIALYKMGIFDAALFDFQKSIILENDNAYAYYFVGKIYQYDGKIKTSKKYFEKALMHNDEHSESLYELADFQFKRRNYDTALVLVRKSISAFRNIDALKLYCLISFMKSDFSEAVSSFREIIKTNPSEIYSLINSFRKLKKKPKITKKNKVETDYYYNIILSILFSDYKSSLKSLYELKQQNSLDDETLFLEVLINSFSIIN